MILLKLKAQLNYVIWPKDSHGSQWKVEITNNDMCEPTNVQLKSTELWNQVQNIEIDFIL